MQRRHVMLAIVLAGAAVAARAVEPVDPDLIPEARKVLDYLAAVYGKQTLSASVSGVAGWVQETTGHLPAIQGFDLSGWNSPTWGKIYTPVVEKTIAEVQAWWARGGIVQMQFHWKNPTRPDGSAWAGLPPGRGTGPVDCAAAIKPGTPVNLALLADLKKHADYLQKLADARVPILWRPFHEIDGGWFWWTDTAQPENTAALWRLMYDYLVKERKLHNLIWVYSAGVHAGGLNKALKIDWNHRREPTMEEEVAFRKRYYPGAQYVDLAGIDIYPGSGYGQPTEDVYPRAFAVMQQVAPGKMLAMCESGVPLNPDLMQQKGPKWLYNLQWFEGEAAWDRTVYSHAYIITADELPVLTPHHASPCIRLLAPADGASITAGAVQLRAEATARGGSIAKVEFYRLAGTWKNWFIASAKEKAEALQTAQLIGSATAAPFACEWKNPPAGLHNIIAKATDAQNASEISNVGRVTIGVKNLALGCQVTASSKTEQAAKAVDGGLFSAWNGERGGTKGAAKKGAQKPAAAPTVKALEQWLAVDLGSEQTVGAVSIAWWKAYAKSYQVQVSGDGSLWKDVYSTNTKSEYLGNTDVIRFDPVKARHVRLLCTQPGTDWGGYTVYELGVYAALPK